MKKLISPILAIVMMAGFSNNLMAQDTETTNANAKILTALTLAEDADLNFGTMARPTTAATVIIAPAGTRSSTGTITLLAQAPTAHAAAYTATGDGTATFAITLPVNGVVTVTNGTPADDMAVNSFTCSETGSNPTFTSALVAGTKSFTVGATLVLANAQASGTYTGTFDV